MGLETKAEAFQALQSLQADAQTRLYNQVNQTQNDMYTTQRLLAEVTTSASGLQAAIEEIAHMLTFGGITTEILRWCGMLLAVGKILLAVCGMLLAVFVIYQFSPQYTGYATATLGRHPFLN